MADSIVGRLIYKITGDLSDIKTSLSNAEKNVKKFTNFMKSAAGLFGVAAAFRVVSGAVKDVLDAALEAEQAETKLAAAMRISGDASREHARQLTGLAKALSLVTTFTDEETVGAMTTLTEIGNVSAAGMRQLIPLVQDLATGLGIDLDTAATAVSKGLLGNVTGLRKMGIEIKAAADPTERFNNIVKSLTANFGGMSEAMAKSAGGGLKQITMQFDELKEAVGARLLQAFKGTISALASQISARVVLKTDIGGIGSLEENTIYIKTLQTELTRVRGIIKEMQAQRMPLFQGVQRGAIELAQKDAAELSNKIEALVRHSHALAAVQIDLPPIIINTAEALAAQAAEAKKLAEDELATYIAATKRQVARRDGWRQDAIARREAADAEAKIQEDAIQAEIEGNTRRMEYEAAAAKAQEDAIQAEIEANTERMDNEREAEDAAAADRIQRERDTAATIRQIRDDTFNFVSGLIAAIGNIQQAGFNKDLAALDKKQQAELDAFTGTEEEKAELVKEFAKQKAKIEYDAALAGWKLQVAAGLVSSAEAVMRALELPPPASYVAAALNATLAAIQMAAIMAAKPIPTFATGGEFIVPPGYPNDSYLMGVQSGEGVSVTPAGATGRETVVAPLILMIDNKPFYQGLLRATKDGIALVHQRGIVR